MQYIEQEHNMKQIQTLIGGLIVGGTALAMASTLLAQTPEQLTAKVVRIKGAARFTTGNNVWQPLKVGAIIKPGTVVQTGMDGGSYVDLVLGAGNGEEPSPVVYSSEAPATSDTSAPPPTTYETKATQSVIRLTENTLLGIDKLTTLQTGADEVSDTELDLKAGRILGNVKKVSAASKFEIKLPNGVAGIRGTCFDISASGLVRCIIGSVVYTFVGSDGSVTTKEVNGGMECDSHNGAITPISSEMLKRLFALFNNMHPPHAGGGGPGPLHEPPPFQNISHHHGQ